MPMTDPTITCPWTGRTVPREEAILLPAIIPGVPPRLAAPEAGTARQASYRAYADCEQNCNTCRHLERVPHPKCPHGWLEGTCRRDGRALRFHPEDPLHLACYESRWVDTPDAGR